MPSKKGRLLIFSVYFQHSLSAFIFSLQLIHLLQNRLKKRRNIVSEEKYLNINYYSVKDIKIAKKL